MEESSGRGGEAESWCLRIGGNGGEISSYDIVSCTSLHTGYGESHLVGLLDEGLKAKKFGASFRFEFQFRSLAIHHIMADFYPVPGFEKDAMRNGTIIMVHPSTQFTVAAC